MADLLSNVEFKKLEKLNAQIDVWIDEEEYGEVNNIFSIDTNFKKNLKQAFPIEESCSKGLDKVWMDILGESNELPIIALKEHFSFNGDDYLQLYWSRLLWAKQIRAKIQEKGTDCFLRRTDDVISYLERHQPIINSDDVKSIKLSVIYLLEMAANGEGSDIRSFADRARRVLKRHLMDSPFKKFYELVARYHIGISFFHEASYRNAILEFNYIIYEWYEHNKNKNEKFEKKLYINYINDKNLSNKLLLFPSYRFRADIQLKLQLAYHAVKTTDVLDKLLSENDNKYLKQRIALIKAEAYQQMSKEAKKQLDDIQKFLLGYTITNRVEAAKKITENKKNKVKNISGRFMDFVADELLYKLRHNYLRNKGEITEFIDYYYETVQYNSVDRKGYAQYLMRFLEFVSRYNNEDAIKVYKKNKAHGLFEKPKGKINCDCENKGFDLDRLNPEHYDRLTKDLLKFYKRNNDFKNDRSDFIKRLLEIEENNKENREWYKKKLESKDQNKSFCKTCCLKDSNGDDDSFLNLLNCAGQNDHNGQYLLDSDDYERVIETWYEQFFKHLKNQSKHEYSVNEDKKHIFHFLGLRRWNSASPAKGNSLGGGYLLYTTDKNGNVKLGIAIDPGFDFIKNLFHEGFGLRDIDIVLLSHAHLDHIRDFESMVTLLLELRKRGKEDHKLHVIMTLGIYRRLEHIIMNSTLRDFIDPYIIDIDKEIDPNFLNNYKYNPFSFHLKDKNKEKLLTRVVAVTDIFDEGNTILTIEIQPTISLHDDFSEYSDSYGYIIDIRENHGEKCHYKFGYTGDTRWDKIIMKSYNECNTVLVHLGSMLGTKNGKENWHQFSYYEKSGQQCFDLVKDKNHPYFPGILHFLTEISKWKKKNKLVLMGEFGEELRGKIRLDFVQRINKSYPDITVLPVDVGLDVCLGENEKNDERSFVRCSLCDTFFPISKKTVKFETYGFDEGLFCVCKTCKKSVSQDVKLEKLRRLYEIGREFRKYDDEKKTKDRN